MKVIVTGESEKVVGIHIIGMGADEMMQGFGVAMKVRNVFCHVLVALLKLGREKCVLL